MNEIAIINSKLTPLEKQFVALREGYKSIKDLPEGLVRRTLTDILSKAMFDTAGQKDARQSAQLEAQILQAQSDACFREVNKHPFNNLTLPEISVAFERGIRGETGSYFGLCPKTYHQFIKYYYELPERGKAWIKRLEEMEQKEIEPKPSIFNSPEYIRKAIDDEWAYFKEHGTFSESILYDLPYMNATRLAWMYDNLCKFEGKKSMIESKAVRLALWNEAKVEYAAYLRKCIAGAEKNGNQDLALELKALFEKDPKELPTLINIAKKKYLEYYFTEKRKNQ